MRASDHFVIVILGFKTIAFSSTLSDSIQAQLPRCCAIPVVTFIYQHTRHPVVRYAVWLRRRKVARQAPMICHRNLAMATLLVGMA